jgi:predicted secreted protein
MKTIRDLFFATIVTAFAASATLAGDYADLKFIGFSNNGKYMAFEESGEWDGAGGNYATTCYIDVEKNKYAMPPTVFEWDDESKRAKSVLFARYTASVAAAIKKLRIVRGNTGKQVVAHLLTDWSYVKPVETDSYWLKDGKPTTKKMPNYEGAFIDRGDLPEKVTFNPWLYVNSFNTDAPYELTLLKTPAGSKACENSTDPLKIELTLKDNTHHEDTDLQILQKDVDLPDSRHCPYGYRIEQVYFYKDNVVVFLNMFSQGFEGPDMRYMAVTGALEYESVPPG